MIRLISWVTGILTLTLAVFAFVLSFNALTDLADQHGVSVPPLLPLVVEAGVIIFSLNVLHRSLMGQPKRWQWTLVIGSSLLAGAFNVAHAQADSLSRFIAAMPSLFLLLSFESFLSLVRYSVERREALQTLETLRQDIETEKEQQATLTTHTASLEAKKAALESQIKSLRKEKRKFGYEVSVETVEKAKAIIAERPGISGAELGRQLGRSDSLGRRLKKSLNGAQAQ